MGLANRFGDFNLNKQPLPDAPTEVEAISGALMLVRKEALIEIGGWDEGYFLHCEDLDLCMQFRKAGFKILFVPNASVIHAKGICSNSKKLFVSWHKHRGMLRFYKKFFRKKYSSLLTFIISIGIYIRFFCIALFYYLNKYYTLFSKN